MISPYGFPSTWCLDGPVDAVSSVLSHSAGCAGWAGAAKIVDALET